MASPFETQLEKDLQWREGELAVFREMLANHDLSEARSRTLFRAAWALLYAHYEGYVKFCLDAYLDEVSKACGSCRALSEKMFVLAIEKEIRAAKTLASFDIYRFFSSELELLRDGKPKFAATDTRSNLWPDILRALLDSVEIAMDVIAPDERKITTLVARRNDIAHGKQVFITDLAYYKEYEAVVLGVMYELTLAVSAKFAAFEEALEAASNPVRG